MAAPVAAAAPPMDIPIDAIPHSAIENSRMDGEMEDLVDPLLKWYKIVRYAPQPTFERRDGQIRLVARATPLETYAPFWIARVEGSDISPLLHFSS